MDIKLSPTRVDDFVYEVSKKGNTLTINGELFDFSRMQEGDRLPTEAISSTWFEYPGNVEVVDGVMQVCLRLPLPHNYSPEQAYPEPLIDVPDGPVVFPAPLPEYIPPVSSSLEISATEANGEEL